MKKIRTRTAELYIDQYGILHLQVLADAKMDQEDALDNLLVIRHLTNNQPVLKLFDLRQKNWSINKATFDFLESKETENKTIARAIVTTSFTNKLLVHFLARIYKKEIPFNIFSSPEAAIEWLRKKGRA